jgi:hypothetical protein
MHMAPTRMLGPAHGLLLNGGCALDLEPWVGRPVDAANIREARLIT